jgi:CYTH domain-containing protein
MIERERRFLVAAVPDPLPAGTRIEQGYLTTEPVSVRVRRQDGRFTLTIKTGSGLARTEIERDLAADEFDALWAVAHDLRIEKRRHLVPVAGGHIAELDLFDGALAGRQIVEVEFDSDDAAHAFEPPGWFGREVTDDRRFTNSSLARRGWPDD